MTSSIFIKTIIAAGLATCITSPGFSADIIQSNELHPAVAIHRHHPRTVKVVRTTYVEQRRYDCGDMIVEYRDSGHREVVRICNRQTMNLYKGD